jgi:phospholipid/cholesterol/gamma-HCH transport system permease protein
LLQQEAVVPLHLDCLRMDSAGVGLLEALRKDLAKVGRRLVVQTKQDNVRNLLQMYGVPVDAEEQRTEKKGLFLRVGTVAHESLKQGFEFLVLTADTLALLGRAIFLGRVSGKALVEQCVRMGTQSLPVIGLISFLVGLTMALQAAQQLRQFGANIYIADLVGVAMLAEMGPLMTAILLAGRCGSSVAAEIATMVIAEEVDALKTMGIDPLRYVLAPRLLALILMAPLLTLLATALGTIGGLLVAVAYLDISPTAFYIQWLNAVGLKDLLQAILKGFVFAGLIGLVAAHVGFRARGGATGVGRSTTAAVVASIFLVILADAVFSFIFYF